MTIEYIQDFIKNNLIDINGQFNRNRMKKSWFELTNNVDVYLKVLELTNFITKDIPISQRLRYFTTNVINNPYCECGSHLVYIANEYRCSSSYKCIHYLNISKQRRVETSLKRYGATNVMLNKEYSDKFKKSFFEKYGVENPSQVEEVKNKKIETTLSNYGVENPFQSEEIKQQARFTKLNKYDDENYNNLEKMKQTKFEKYGDENYNNIEKSKETNLLRYGVDHYSKTDMYKESYKNTCQEKYGVNYYISCDEFSTKSKITCQERYGVDHCGSAKEFIIKRQNTCLERYGYIAPAKNIDVKNKAIETNILRYGFEYPNQNKSVFQKVKKYSWKDYTLPSGKVIKIQGYENYALDLLLTEYEESDLITTGDNMVNIQYFYKDRNRIYHPDIYIPKENLIIEVKSDYTYKLDFKKNLAKQQACLNSGYNFKFMIFNGKKELIC